MLHNLWHLDRFKILHGNFLSNFLFVTLDLVRKQMEALHLSLDSDCLGAKIGLFCDFSLGLLARFKISSFGSMAD